MRERKETNKRNGKRSEKTTKGMENEKKTMADSRLDFSRMMSCAVVARE